MYIYTMGPDSSVVLQMGPSGSSKTTLLGMLILVCRLLPEDIFIVLRHTGLFGVSSHADVNLFGADVLAGRKTVGTITGKILFAGQHATKTFLRRYTGYVEQFGGTAQPCIVMQSLALHACAPPAV